MTAMTAAIAPTVQSGLTPQELRAVSWCVSADVSGGAACDDPAQAVEGWCRAARRAMETSGRDLSDDALLRALDRVGLDSLVAAYIAARAGLAG